MTEFEFDELCQLEMAAFDDGRSDGMERAREEIAGLKKTIDELRKEIGTY